MSELDADVVLARALTAARDLTGARYAAIGVLDESGTELEHFETLGIDNETRRRIASLPRGRGLLGELISNPGPLRVADIGRDPRAYGFPPGHPPMRSFLGVPIMAGDKPLGNLYLAEKAGGAEFGPADEELLGVLAGFVGVAIDHSHRLARSEARGEELQRAAVVLDATVRFVEALGGHTDARTILGLVCEHGRTLVSAGALLVEVAHDGALEVVAGAGALAVPLIGRHLDLEGTVAAVALETRRPQRLSDEANRGRFEGRGLGVLGLRARDALVVPLVFRAETYGVLVAIDPLDGPTFTSDHERLLESFAASAASALATARLAAFERRRQSVAAAEAERTRWARELHDATLQGLASLRLLLAVARRRGGEAITDAVEEAVHQLDGGIAGLRALIADLRPPALDELGTEAAVRALAERHGRAGLHVDLIVDLAREQGRTGRRHIPELETTIYRIAQEALTNASSHGGARNAIVEIHEHRDAVRITVRDDGIGFDPATAIGGFGLASMRERAELLGGALSVESAPGGPTTVTATLPVLLRDP